MSVNAVKGKAALHLSRELGAQYKTAWVLSLKIKEALGLRRVDMKLDGQVQMDGKYAGGHIKPENKAEERIDPSSMPAWRTRPAFCRASWIDGRRFPMRSGRLRKGHAWSRIPRRIRRSTAAAWRSAGSRASSGACSSRR